MDKDKVIKLQRELIGEYEQIFSFINDVCVNVIKNETRFKEENHDSFNRELLDFAWSTNDVITDIDYLKLLKTKIDELMEEN